MSEKQASDGQVIKFNVGGEFFATTKTTLERFGENMLTRLTSTSVPTVEIKGAYFIDRDNELFGHVLNVLRGSFDHESNAEILEQVQSELDFYAVRANVTTEYNEAIEQAKVAKQEKMVHNARMMIQNLEGRYSMNPEITLGNGRKVFAIEKGQVLHFLFNVPDRWFFPAEFEFEKMLYNRETFWEFVAFCAKYTSQKILWETAGPVRLFYISH